jgi:2-polyprenyl-3-methyl-5-hydroxy-6-metoxy-1,4-benzoquinol methylase
MTDVAPDGSPVQIYAALPAEPELGRVRSLLAPGARILDLGCGTGRIANPLAADGYAVVAVDNSEAMLARVVGAETVLGDVRTLDVGRQFDVVLALSHLINHPERSLRLDLLRVCRKHLADDGVVVVQRYSPDWVPSDSQGASGDVAIHLHHVVHRDARTFAATVTYTLDGHSWSQSFEATIVDDDELASLALASGLTVSNATDDPSWVILAASTGT